MASDEPILIKRYANRKLYDQSRSRYVTLEELEELIRQGREIRVVDAVSGEDLTSQTLAQIILDTARGRRTALPVAFLHQLIQHGTAWQDVRPGVAPVEPLGNRGEPAGDRAGPPGLGGAGGLVAVGSRGPATGPERRLAGCGRAPGRGRRAEGEAAGSRVAARRMSQGRAKPPPARPRCRPERQGRAFGSAAGDQPRA